MERMRSQNLLHGKGVSSNENTLIEGRIDSNAPNPFLPSPIFHFLLEFHRRKTALFACAKRGGDSWYCDGTVIFKRHYFIVFIKTLLFEMIRILRIGRWSVQDSV